MTNAFKPKHWVLLKTIDKKKDKYQILGARETNSLAPDTCRLSPFIGEFILRENIITFTMDNCEDYVCDTNFEGISSSMDPIFDIKKKDSYIIIPFSEINLKSNG